MQRFGWFLFLAYLLQAFVALACAQPLSINFEESDLVAAGVEIETQFDAPDFVPGIGERAFRSDGFSSSAKAPLDLGDAQNFTVSMWTALESYPSDHETFVENIKPASFINQATKNRGFDIYIDTYGRWGARIETTSGRVKLEAPDVFPVYAWAHIALRFDAPGRKAELLLDGNVVAEKRISSSARLKPASTDLQIARSWEDTGFLVFMINGLNGAFDDVEVLREAKSVAEIKDQYDAMQAELPDAWASLIVPETRFANDHHRPRYHAMPPANWTNEPHGLVKANGRYHMFYQRTPNGPYKTQMHWGHISSEDLVTWKHHRDALWPELQSKNAGFDMKGIWSGDVIFEGGVAYAYYTSVNHFDSYNPGVSVAVSTDPELEFWEKRGPILDTTYVEDFRDPYLWKDDGDTYHMIIGAALKSGGGLDYYTCTATGKATCWEHQRNFMTARYGDLDIGSIIWEMPVFEKISDEKYLLLVNPIGGKVSKFGEPSTRAVYWTGKWEEGQFTPDSTVNKPQDLLPGQLAPTVARDADGQLVAVGIIDERRSPQSQEDAGWANTFSLPREWYLLSDGRTLGQRPLAALASLREENVELAPLSESYAETTLITDPGLQAEMLVEFSDSTTGAFGVVLASSADGSEQTVIYFDPATNEIVLDKSRSTLSSEGEGPQFLRGDYDIAAYGMPLKWHVFIDGSVIELFINGSAATAFRTYPTDPAATQIGIYSGGETVLKDLKVWRLKDDVIRW